jgi:hypothetical protein
MSLSLLVEEKIQYRGNAFHQINTLLAGPGIGSRI